MDKDPLSWMNRQARAFQTSLLYYPTFLTLGALTLYVVTTYLDLRHQDTLMDLGGEGAPLLLRVIFFGGGPDAAAQLTATIAGTWATITGVVFTVTLVTLQLSATKYSAQVIPTFERDKFNQLVLGFFVATVIYALLVLKTVREQADGFVPIIGVNASVLFAVVSLFLFIGFVANLSAYVRPTRFVDGLGRRVKHHLAALREPVGNDGYEKVGGHPTDPATQDARFVTVVAPDEGYVERIDWKKLRNAVHDMAKQGQAPQRIDVHARSMDNLRRGARLATFYGVDMLPRDVADDVRACFKMEDVPGSRDDPVYATSTFADIGVTSMSGGATDVGVGQNCVRALVDLAIADLGHPAIQTSFVLYTENVRVVITRAEPQVHERCLIQLKRVLDKACREGYWDVTEVFVEASLTLYAAAAASSTRSAWRVLLDWTNEAAGDWLDLEDALARRRIWRSLAGIASALRESRHDAEAAELESVLIERGRAHGVEREVRRALEDSLSPP